MNRPEMGNEKEQKRWDMKNAFVVCVCVCAATTEPRAEVTKKGEDLITLAIPPPSSGGNTRIRWRRGELLGKGAYGSVFLALNLEDGNLMAVKQVGGCGLLVCIFLSL
jgi:hypothetical protein